MAVASAPAFAPSSWNCTPAIPMLLDAEAVTFVVPETVAPGAGNIMETVVVGGGGVVLPDRGTIPQFGVPANPLFSTVLQFVAPVRRVHEADAPVAPWSTA